MNSNKESVIWLVVNSVAVLLLLIFVSIAMLLEPNWIDINSYLGGRLNASFNYVLGILGVTLIPFAYLIWRMFRLLTTAVRGNLLAQSLVNKATPVVVSISYAAVLMLLIALWGEDGVLVVRALEYMSPVLFIVLGSALLLGLYFLLPTLITVYRNVRQGPLRCRLRETAILGLTLLVCSLVLTAPAVLVPSNVVTGDLPDKPMLIAHRGGSSIGPENTLEAAQRALSFGITGIEIDVQISLDGVPFLMHDDNLKRTTNVEELFPENETKRASSFIISRLRELDAGTWFAEKDPYGTIAAGVVSTSQAEGYRGALIPTLVEMLDFVKANGLLLDVDFKPPPTGHPFYWEYFNICLSTLQSADIDDRIWIATGNTSWLSATDALAPDMILAIGVGSSDNPTIDEFEATGYDMINTHHGLPNDVFVRYELEHIIVNAWTVNTVFRYSQLWCLGVDYVTTDYPQSFHTLAQPVWSLPPIPYKATWVFGYIVAFSVFALLTRRRGTSLKLTTTKVRHWNGFRSGRSCPLTLSCP